MLFRQILHEDLGCASYLVGDSAAGVGAVVDPKLDVRDYLTLADQLGIAIDHVLETHTHADHVSGGAALRAATGARAHAPRLALAEYDHESIDDGWELKLGAVTLRAIHTPGHRPEHTAFAILEPARDGRSWGVLTGDSLFAGDVARPDLAVDGKAGARALFRSLHERLLQLDDEVLVWPGHVGGSLCGSAQMDRTTTSTIGWERRHDELLRLVDEREFVERLTSALGRKPPNFEAIVALNRRSEGAAAPRVERVTAQEAAARRDAGALVVDVRPEHEFAAAHVPGALCVSTAQVGFGTRLASVADHERDLVLVGRDEADASRAALLAAAVGLRGAGAVLTGGMADWAASFSTTAMERISVDELHERLAVDDRLQVLDVRDGAERAAGAIPGSAWTPYRDLDDVPAALDPGRPIAVVCASGRRSALGASLLAHHGARQAIVVADGGVATWTANGWPLERPVGLVG